MDNLKRSEHIDFLLSAEARRSSVAEKIQKDTVQAVLMSNICQRDWKLFLSV